MWKKTARTILACWMGAGLLAAILFVVTSLAAASAQTCTGITFLDGGDALVYDYETLAQGVEIAVFSCDVADADVSLYISGVGFTTGPDEAPLAWDDLFSIRTDTQPITVGQVVFFQIEQTGDGREPNTGQFTGKVTVRADQGGYLLSRDMIVTVADPQPATTVAFLPDAGALGLGYDNLNADPNAVVLVQNTGDHATVVSLTIKGGGLTLGPDKVLLSPAELFSVTPLSRPVAAGQVVDFNVGLAEGLSRPNDGQFIGKLIAIPRKGTPDVRDLTLTVPSLDQETSLVFVPAGESLELTYASLKDALAPPVLVQNSGQHPTVVTLTVYGHALAQGEAKTALPLDTLLMIDPPVRTAAAGETVSFSLKLAGGLAQPNEGQFSGRLVAAPSKGQVAAIALTLNVPPAEQATSLEFAGGDGALSYQLSALNPITHPVEVVIKNTGEHSTVATLEIYGQGPTTGWPWDEDTLTAGELFVIRPPTRTVAAGDVATFTFALTQRLSLNPGNFDGQLVARPVKGTASVRQLKLVVPAESEIKHWHKLPRNWLWHIGRANATIPAAALLVVGLGWIGRRIRVHRARRRPGPVYLLTDREKDAPQSAFVCTGDGKDLQIFEAALREHLVVSGLREGAVPGGFLTTSFKELTQVQDLTPQTNIVMRFLDLLRKLALPPTGYELSGTLVKEDPSGGATERTNDEKKTYFRLTLRIVDLTRGVPEHVKTLGDESLPKLGCKTAHYVRHFIFKQTAIARRVPLRERWETAEAYRHYMLGLEAERRAEEHQLAGEGCKAEEEWENAIVAYQEAIGPSERFNLQVRLRLANAFEVKEEFLNALETYLKILVGWWRHLPRVQYTIRYRLACVLACEAEWAKDWIKLDQDATAEVKKALEVLEEACKAPDGIVEASLRRLKQASQKMSAIGRGETAPAKVLIERLGQASRDALEQACQGLNGAPQVAELLQELEQVCLVPQALQDALKDACQNPNNAAKRLVALKGWLQELNELDRKGRYWDALCEGEKDGWPTFGQSDEKKLRKFFLTRARCEWKKLINAVSNSYASKRSPYASKRPIEKIVGSAALCTELQLLSLPEPLDQIKNIDELEKDIRGFHQWGKANRAWQVCYNVVCFYSLAIDHHKKHAEKDKARACTDKALRLLDEIFAAPDSDLTFHWLEKDPDLEALRREPKYEQWKNQFTAYITK